MAAPKRDRAVRAVARIKAEGRVPTTDEVMAEANVGRSLANEVIGSLRDAERAGVLVTPEFEMTASAAKKLEMRSQQQEREFEARVNVKAQALHDKWRDEHMIPQIFEKIAAVEQMLTWPRFGVMTKNEYNKIVKCLHPDSIHGRTEVELAEAFRIFTSYKPKMVADEQERVKVLNGLPRTFEEMMAGKRRRA